MPVVSPVSERSTVAALLLLTFATGAAMSRFVVASGFAVAAVAIATSLPIFRFGPGA